MKRQPAPRTGTGFVRLDITAQPDMLLVTVSNSGECDSSALTATGVNGGIGLANVRRRLELCYGEQSSFLAEVADGVTTVGFLLPLRVGVVV